MKQIKMSPVSLTIRGAGVKPTIAKRKSAVYGDTDFDPKKNLMVGQFAFNVDDKVWYYRSKTGIEELVPKSSGEKVFFITETMTINGYESTDFSLTLPDVPGEGSHDTLTIHTPGLYVINIDTDNVKSLLIAVDSVCIDKRISIKLSSGSDITYANQTVIRLDDIELIEPLALLLDNLADDHVAEFVLSSFYNNALMPIKNATLQGTSIP